MTRWDEWLHPRDSEGRFTERWAHQLAAALPAGSHLGVSGDEHDWEKIGPDEAGRELVDKLAAHLDPWFVGRPHKRDERVRELIGTKIPAARAVYRQGPHQIMVATDSDIPEHQIRQIQQILASLDAIAPSRDPVHLRIQEPRHMVLSPKTYAETIRGTGIIGLSTAALDDSDWDEETHGKPRHFMPSAQQTGKLEYILSHEWGHVIDYPDQPGGDEHAHSIMAESFADVLSDYGNRSLREAYAEAFAEWYNTGGNPTNEAAAGYADMYGWEGY